MSNPPEQEPHDAAADAIATSVKTSVGAIGGLGGLKSPELEKAAKNSPACKSLGS